MTQNETVDTFWHDKQMKDIFIYFPRSKKKAHVVLYRKRNDACGSCTAFNSGCRSKQSMSREGEGRPGSQLLHWWSEV